MTRQSLPVSLFHLPAFKKAIKSFSAGFVNDVFSTVDAADNPCIFFSSDGAFDYQYAINTLLKPVTYKIMGLGKVKANQKNVTYTLTAPAGTYTWAVLQGAKMISGLETRKIKVNFGTSSDYVSAIKEGTTKADGQRAQLYVTVSSSSAAFITFPMPDATEESTAFKVYPNPVSSTANILFYNPEKASKYTLSVTDASGKIIAKQSGVAAYGNNTIQLSMNQYRSGLYFVSFITEKETRMMKLYKQ